MSLAIYSEKITEILLADGWHMLQPGSHMTFDCFEIGFYKEPEETNSSTFDLTAGYSNLENTGFEITEIGAGKLYGLVKNILAVRSRKSFNN